jgi:hypothetical protein
MLLSMLLLNNHLLYWFYDNWSLFITGLRICSEWRIASVSTENKYMRKFKAGYLIATVVFMGSCSKTLLQPNSVEGTYKGQFELKNTDSAQAMPGSGAVTVNFTATDYKASANSNYIPAGGAGTYSVRKDSIDFKDDSMHTANFDWNLLLNGTYRYTVKGDSIMLSKELGTQIYLYKLKKEKGI